LASHFKRSESLAHGAKRLLQREFDSAVELLAQADQPLDFRVHEARKCLKRLRALLSLVEDNVDPEQVTRARACIRAAAHALADLRSSAALNETFDALVERYPGSLEAPIIDGVRRALTRPTESMDTTQALTAALDALGRARDAAQTLDVSGHGWSVVDRGFRRTYARARKYFSRAHDSRSVDQFHEFRTQLKRHYYQLELFSKVWPRLVRAECRELDRLGERLGEHHDLSLLLPELERKGLEQAAAAELPALIDRRKRDLESKVLSRAARLFAEAPRARARRFAGYHAAFRRSRPRKKT
jgi:CHAD domain-containing protein